MTKEQLAKIREAIIVLAELPNEEWKKIYNIVGYSPKKSQEPIKNKDREVSLREKITILLKKLGIRANIRGYTYLRSAIIFYMKAENLVSITKELYPAIAKEFNETPMGVERAIRHAIETAWKKTDNIVMREEVFGDVVNFKRGIPSNGEMITYIAEYLKIH